MINVVSGIILEEKKLLLARKEVSGKSSWIFPGGKMEKGEHYFDCLVRELKEELPYLQYNGLWIPWDCFTGISPNNSRQIYVFAFYLDGKTNGNYRVSENPDEKIKEARLFEYSELSNLATSEVSKKIISALKKEDRI
jgi:ADP-ribose pyrophosphatase YjhB (NUDIX family)